MKLPRASGILLHPTSLPGPDGIGDLGPEAYHWIDFLNSSGTKLWQVLPLGPTGYGDSPYQCFSAFAGNPYLISPTLLLDQGLLTRVDLIDRPDFPVNNVDYGCAIKWKITLLDRAFQHFRQNHDEALLTRFSDFQENNSFWLKDFSLFMAIKDSQGGGSWLTWSLPLKMRDEAALKAFTFEHQEEILKHSFKQFIFFEQWQKLKDYSEKNGVSIIGDVPIFVSMDSSDAWSHRDLFFTDAQGNPTAVAGVPPDYFSPTGQLWGNPLYNWKIHANTGYAWWIERMKASLKLFNWIRLDHFRGFAAYWKVTAGSPTAEIGKWEKGPGSDLFQTLQDTLGELPIIAEDLGVITPDVDALRENFDLPGMRILQFAFGGDPKDRFLPHNYERNTVAYTGTHDNDTTRGWYESAPESERDFCRRYLGRDGSDITWDMIRTIWASVAAFALTPMQDILNLGTEARMNYPSKPDGNWGWRLPVSYCTRGISERIKELNNLYDR